MSFSDGCRRALLADEARKFFIAPHWAPSPEPDYIGSSGVLWKTNPAGHTIGTTEQRAYFQNALRAVLGLSPLPYTVPRRGRR